MGAAPTVQAKVTYDLIDLSAFGPDPYLPGIATGINNAGNIVGNLYDASGQESGGWFLAAGATQWTALPRVAGSTAEVRAVAINNNNLILGANLRHYPEAYGTYFTPEDPRAATWLYRPGAAFFEAGSRIGMPPALWEPLSMNDSGVMLIRSTVDTPFGTVAVVDRLFNGGTTRVWQGQGYPTTMPLAINNAGDMVGGKADSTGLYQSDFGVRYTALNNVGLKVGLRDGVVVRAEPVLTWLEPDGGPVFGQQSYREVTVDLKTLMTPGQSSLELVTGINDLGQIVGRAGGRAALLNLVGAVELLAVPPNPFDPGSFGSFQWDTALGRLPNWKASGNVDFVIAPTNPTGTFVSNFPGSNSPLDDLNNASIRNLTIGNVGVPSAPGAQHTSVTLQSMNLLVTGAVTVGGNADLRLVDTGFDARQGGVVVRGGLMLFNTTLRGNLANRGGDVVVGDGTTATVSGNVVNDVPISEPGNFQPGGNQTLWVNTGARLIVTGDIQNTTNVQVLSGARLEARSFTQTAGQLVVNGELNTFGGDVVVSGGGLYGSGVINAVQLTVGTNGPQSAAHPFIAPGNSPGHLTVNGAFVLGANGTLELQVERAADGSLGWDRLTATSMSFLDGSTVHFAVGSGVAGAQWQSLAFLDCGSGCQFGNGVSFVVDGAPGASVQFSSAGLVLGVAPAQAVPEPGTTALWLAGLLAVPGLVRRRRCPAGPGGVVNP